MAAEIYYAKFVAELNLAFLAADHFTRLVRVMFPDSRIAEAYSSVRTKTSAIITHALAPKLEEAIDTSVIHLLSQFFVMTSSTGSTLRS